MAFREETSWRPRRQCPRLRHQRPTCISGSPESEARGLHGAGRQDPERTLLHSDQQRPRAPSGLYLTPLCFNTNSPERKPRPFGGGGGGNSGLWCSGAQPPVTSGWARLPAAEAGGTKGGTVRGPRPRPALCRCRELSAWGAVQGLEAKTTQRREAEPQESVSVPHVLCILSQHYAHGIQSGAPGRGDPPWPPSRGRRDRVSEGPRSTTGGVGGLPHTQEEEESSKRSL